MRDLYGTEKTLGLIGPFAYQPKSPIDGLWMCGASTVAHGVMGATLRTHPRDLLADDGPELEIRTANHHPRYRAPRMPDSLRDLRRQQIIAAARALVSSGGLEALTISRLEKELDYSRGVITYHFEGKDEIVEAVLESALEEIFEAAGAVVVFEDTIGKKIRAMLRGMVGGFVERREATQILVSFWARIPNDVHATKLNADLYRNYRAEAARVLGRAKKDGLTRIKPKQIDAVAGLLVGIVVGIACQLYFEAGSVDADAMIEIAAKSLEQHLG